MSLKIRFSLYYSLLFSLGLIVFSAGVYFQVKKQLEAGAQEALHAHLQHEWKHIETQQGNDRDTNPTLHTKDVYQRIWENGVLIYDTIPAGITISIPPVGEIQHTAGGMLLREERVLGGARYEFLGLYETNSIQQSLSALGKFLILFWLGALLVIVPVSLFFTRFLLKPFRELSSKTLQLDVQHLFYRFTEPKTQDEYGILVKSFNALLDRLERSFAQVRRFATNASHELRTPLTVIRGEAEVMLRRPREINDYQTALKRITHQTQTLQQIIKRLLFFADLEHMEQAQASQKVTIPVRALIHDLLNSLRKMHPDEKKDVQIEVDKNVVFVGHNELFSSLVTNLIENALKYSSGHVVVACEKDEKGLHFQVDDDGPGIAPEEQERVFEPFVKNPVTSNPRHNSGHGLGLAIVKSYVEAAQGLIKLARSPLGGLAVSVTIPQST